jgi:hypothetical protein
MQPRSPHQGTDAFARDLLQDPEVRATENVLLAAYLRYKGIKQIYVEKIKRGKGVFYFKMENSKWNSLVQEYDNSPELKFEHCRVDTVNLTYT